MAFRLTVEIEQALSPVWEAWASSEQLVKWLAPKAHIVFEPGGCFEFFWETDPQKNSTLGCVLLNIEPEKRLFFEWQGPPDFLHLFLSPEGHRTPLEVVFLPTAPGTQVTLTQSETRDSQAWNDYEAWMSAVWRNALTALKTYCESLIL